MRREGSISLALCLLLGQQVGQISCLAAGAKPAQHKSNLKPERNAQHQQKSAPNNESEKESEKESEIDYSGYMQNLQAAIKKNWHPHSIDRHRSSLVTFRIRSNGEIYNVALQNTSGNPSLDQAGIDAVLKTSPAAPLPDGSPDSVDIQFTFDFNNWSGRIASNSTGDRTAARLVNEARILTGKGSFAAALTKLKGARAAESSNVSVTQLDATSKAISTKLQPADAAKLLRRALYINSEDSYIHSLLETAMKKQGQDPRSAQTRLELARTLRDAGDIDGSVAEYKECFALSGDTRVNDELMKVNQRSVASDLLDRWQTALAFKDNAENHTGVGYAYEVSGDTSNAEREYRTALLKDSNFEMATQRLNALLAHPVVASKDFDIADLKINRKESAPVAEYAKLNNAGVKLMNEGKIAEAIEIFNEALRLNPNYKYAKSNLSIAYNNYALHLPAAQAAKYFRKAIYTDGNPNSLKNLNGCLKAMKIDPKSFPGRVKAADACESAKDYEGAIVEYRCALAIKQDASVKNKLAQCLKQVHR